jgi:hypothetical protein
MSTDLHPSSMNVYGYAVAWIPPGATAWTMEVDEEYRSLPAHYMTLAEAHDRVVFLRKRGIKARPLAVIVMPSDSSEALGAICPEQPGDA